MKTFIALVLSLAFQIRAASADEWTTAALYQIGHTYELFAKDVMPAFQDSARTLVESRDWAVANRGELMGKAGAAIMQAIQQHAAEKTEQHEKDGKSR